MSFRFRLGGVKTDVICARALRGCSSQRCLQLPRDCNLHFVNGASGRHFDKPTTHHFLAHVWTCWQLFTGEGNDSWELEDAVLFQVGRED